uniref:Uncharacterized protein n=1 Tax=Escherichia coli TaxID=562 RepID=T2HSI8_ECOLX|nr:hypothetical protein [Escherichia coli]
MRFSTIVSVVTLVWGISPRQPSGKNIIRWLLKKRTNGSVRYCQYTSGHRVKTGRHKKVLAGCGQKDSDRYDRFHPHKSAYRDPLPVRGKGNGITRARSQPHFFTYYIC